MSVNPLPPEDALIYVMVVASAADANMSEKELATIGRIVQTLPAFADYDPNNLIEAGRTCTAILQEKDGLQTVLGLARGTLSATLCETAYALACEVVAADGRLVPEEVEILRLIRTGLWVDRLAAAAIERAAFARYQRV